MDLLTNYGSSDEDEHRESPPPPHQRATAFMPVQPEEDRDFLSNPLPLPKFKSFPNPEPERESGEATQSDEGAVGNTKSKLASSSSFLSFLPLPKSSAAVTVSNSKSKSASLFSSLPLPKSSSSSSSSAKRVVQFRPPSIMKSSGTIDEEDDDDDEGEKESQRKKIKQSVSAISKVSLASIMPPPKNETLGALPSATGSGRRSMLETGISNSGGSKVSTAVSDVVTSSSIGPESSFSDTGANPYAGNFSNRSGEIYGGINPNEGPYDADDYSYENPQAVEFANYEGGYTDYGHHYDQALAGTGSLPESSGVAENLQQVMGRRGRKDAPAEIIEVKQDELMKNRPRQDQVKLTGIAFGPSYQPASTKGKPTKLHKRKHQIGSLYFDLKQRETELAERRAKGFLTKAQTQAKYGW